MHRRLRKAFQQNCFKKHWIIRIDPPGNSSAENLFMKDLTRDASVMGLYECMPVIKRIATNTNAVATREKYATFVTTSESACFFIMTDFLKKFT
jgi:hypothetical protein